MDENNNGSDQPVEPAGPETDDSTNPTEASPEHDAKPRIAGGREMLAQLQNMIDTAGYQAGPTLREIGAKAAELAAIAGAKAGPFAYKAAEVTDQLGQRVAARSKTMAADLRRMRGEGDADGEGEAAAADGETSAAEGETAADGGASTPSDTASSWDAGSSEPTESGPGEPIH